MAIGVIKVHTQKSIFLCIKNNFTFTVSTHIYMLWAPMRNTRYNFWHEKWHNSFFEIMQFSYSCIMYILTLVLSIKKKKKNKMRVFTGKYGICPFYCSPLNESTSVHVLVVTHQAELCL